MKINKEDIVANSKKVYERMNAAYRYSFSELQKLSNLRDIDLCLALANLLRSKIITQERHNTQICYNLTIRQSDNFTNCVL